ncbi:hypothetical protein BKN38_09455 [Helicobacter sp. CLO-3]|uniref:hypothetical protein n=1 Tax=unclassified Helicobacter TaxID=2593540 RepID=UPI0008055F5F|nr:MULTISPECIES: hypothetical protein [unclassified Helicobacter]OBV28826.1 hypothetical protein BA723_07955 [Helicobacter sp. CLO-3]OHU81231.1 hypothetical protein BKN38_09455 [Helicobacter sp. CLO-3]
MILASLKNAWVNALAKCPLAQNLAARLSRSLARNLARVKTHQNLTTTKNQAYPNPLNHQARQNLAKSQAYQNLAKPQTPQNPAKSQTPQTRQAPQNPASHLLRLLALIFICHIFTASAQALTTKTIDIDRERQGWRAELARTSLNFSSTQINNQEDYTAFANSRISGDSQLILQLYGNMLLDYYAKRFVFFNSLLAEYGETMVFINPRSRLRNKTLDRILFSTGYTQRIWRLEQIGGGEIGPFLQLSLQSEFTPSPDMPYRKKYFRFAAGVRLFDGKYIQNLKLNLFGEEDFSDIRHPIESMGAETGITLKRNIREGVDFSTMLNYRHYLVNNYPHERNPQLELELSVRLDTALWKNLTISPFVNLYLLKGRYIENVGSNVFIGVSLGYGKVFKDNKGAIPPAPPISTESTQATNHTESTQTKSAQPESKNKEQSTKELQPESRTNANSTSSADSAKSTESTSGQKLQK